MRKVLALLLVALATLLVLAAPALAFKDPFDPVVTSDTDPATTGTVDEPAVDEPAVVNGGTPFSDGVPNTGADTSSWLVLSYVLVVTGGSVMLLGRVLRPAPPARRQEFPS